MIGSPVETGLALMDFGPGVNHMVHEVLGFFPLRKKIRQPSGRLDVEELCGAVDGLDGSLTRHGVDHLFQVPLQIIQRRVVLLSWFDNALRLPPFQVDPKLTGVQGWNAKDARP